MKRKIFFIISLLFGLMFINAGLNKFFNYMPVPPDLPVKLITIMQALVQVSWLLPLIAIAEITGGILFVIPKTRAVGAIVIFPVLVGVVLTSIFTAPAGLPLAMTLLCIHLLVVIDNWERYVTLFE